VRKCFKVLQLFTAASILVIDAAAFDAASVQLDLKARVGMALVVAACQSSVAPVSPRTQESMTTATNVCGHRLYMLSTAHSMSICGAHTHTR
jgi:hypothetical protein